MSVAVVEDYCFSHYDPSSGRFLTADPIGFAGGDSNFYRYVGNNPVGRNDPSGLDFKICQRYLQGNDSGALLGVFSNVLVHRYIQFKDGGTISVGKNKNGTFGNINESNTPQNGLSCGNNIKSSEEEDDLMKKYASQHMNQNYNYLSNSCKDFTRDVLYNFRQAK